MARRTLTTAEMRIKYWIKQNYGALSKIARDCGVSAQFCQRVAYNREARSKDLRVEKALLALGCPLIQSIDE